MMKAKFIEAFGSIQELFQELNDQGKIRPDQAERFNLAQKDVVNFSSWVDQQLHPIQKVVLPWNEPEFADAWQLWKKFKKEKNFTYKPIGEQSALSHLAEISGGNLTEAIAILKQSREQGWSGLFALKKTNHKQAIEEQNKGYKEHLLNRLTGQ